MTRQQVVIRFDTSGRRHSALVTCSQQDRQLRRTRSATNSITFSAIAWPTAVGGSMLRSN